MGPQGVPLSPIFYVRVSGSLGTSCRTSDQIYVVPYIYIERENPTVYGSLLHITYPMIIAKKNVFYLKKWGPYSATFLYTYTHINLCISIYTHARVHVHTPAVYTEAQAQLHACLSSSEPPTSAASPDARSGAGHRGGHPDGYHAGAAGGQGFITYSNWILVGLLSKLA